MKEILIRTLTKDDVRGAAEIKANGWKTAYKGIIDQTYLNSLSVDDNEKKFENNIGDSNFIVAIEGDKVVGFCKFMNNNSFSPDIEYVDCELSAIYVHPDYKGNGIGTKMFEYVLNEFNSENKTTMILWCLKDNINSIKFYERMGGKIQEIRKVKIGDIEYDEVGIVYDIKELSKDKKVKR